MSKGQRGNKEAKKPKRPVVGAKPTPTAEVPLAAPRVGAGDPPRRK